MNDEQFLDNFYNACDPFEPLPVGDPRYVDCKAVRGNEDIFVLGKKLRRSRRTACLLYSGHRGGGKSTELLKLQGYLRQHDFFVVYFAADEEDVDTEDTEYTDILLACTKHLLRQLKNTNAQPLRDWLRRFWDDIKDVLDTEIDLDSLSAEVVLSQFVKLTANIKAVPSQRRKIRDRVNPHTVTLIEALNQFINTAKQKLPDGKGNLAVIVDGLDRIPPVIRDDSGRTNHDEIFLDRSEQLKGLACHVIYTAPISMMYSRRATDIRDIYSDPQTLPMIKVQNQDNSLCTEGIEAIQNIIAERVHTFNDNLSLETDIFDNSETLQGLCRMSGGHVRNLMLLIQSAIDETETLPIPRRAVQIAITDARDTYRRTVESGQWQLLAEVHRDKKIRNADQYRDLLFNRCILEYVDFDEDKGRILWYDVHPLIRGIPQFRDALDSRPHP
ncbi:ATP-binding protein [Lusitaniella coriacea]|uniref:ATP-binding protein n=1 Tax=Lusitaniella coriacea TaxID=1983105 RepID=UPI003CF3A9AE